VTAHARENQSQPFEKSQQLQRRLYLAAKRSRNRRFYASYDRLVWPDILWRAWKEVRRIEGLRESMARASKMLSAMASSVFSRSSPRT